MPSSKSSLDKRDVYYRKGKSDGYRARSAYKLLHLDEEFDLFRGVSTAVDLCAAPGSWSQVLSSRLKPGYAPGQNRVVSVDLQPMAPLNGVTTMQTDITLPSTVPKVLEALGGCKADLVICDGAPDVTGVHDLDAYIHSQLILAAITLSLTLLAPHATLIFKIFMSPLDPKCALLRSQLRTFFPGPEPGSICFGDQHDDFVEFDDTSTFDNQLERNPEIGDSDTRVSATASNWPQGFDAFGRRGGVWVRKPRSSRKGSGETFIVCRNFDPSTFPLPTEFSPESLERLRQQLGGTLTLESLGNLSTNAYRKQESIGNWPTTRGFVGGGNLNGGAHAPVKPPRQSLILNLNSSHQRDVSLGSLDDAPSPVEDKHNLFPGPSSPQIASVQSPQPRVSGIVEELRLRTNFDNLNQNPHSASPSIRTPFTPGPLSTPVPLPSPALNPVREPGMRDFHDFQQQGLHGPLESRSPAFREFRDLPEGQHEPGLSSQGPVSSQTQTSSLHVHGSSPLNTSEMHVQSFATSSPQPNALSPRMASTLSARERDIMMNTPYGDGAVSPALSSSSKTDAFFSSTQALPTPPRPLAGSGSLSRSRSIGHGPPPATKGRPPSDRPSPTSPAFHTPTPLRSVTGPSSGVPPVIPTVTSASPSSTSPTNRTPALTAAPVTQVTPVAKKPQSSRPEGYIAREVRHIVPEMVPVHTGDLLTPVVDDSFPIRSASSPGSWIVRDALGQGAFASVWTAEAKGDGRDAPSGMIAAVKLIDRKSCVQNQRTAIAFYREVEVLRHLVHPGVVGYISHFSTAAYHCLVLEKLNGGELFSLVSDEKNRAQMLKPGPDDPEGCGLVRRIFGELCRAVSWLHEVEVVHRDIKLENILLTVNPFAFPPTATGSVPLDRLPTPLVKLTDFGLARFIRADSPLLTTRCGSEAFAAPEVVMGNLYDGRRTDAWALGVVLYALVAGELPFDETAPLPKGRSRAGSTASTASSADARETRRRTMHRIAKGEYWWRDGVGSPALRAVVARLLVRDPSRRARVSELWDDPWMSKGPGAVPPPQEPMKPSGGRKKALASEATLKPNMAKGENGMCDTTVSSRDADAEADESEPDIPLLANTPHVVVQQGILVDHERIDEVARYEDQPLR